MSKIMKEIAKILIDKNLTISVCESCTAGGLAYELTKLSGSSKWFDGGLITYTNQSKSKLLGINISFIEIYGPVSKEVSKEMVYSCLNKLKSNIAISITGYAESKNNNGLVFISLSNNSKIETYTLNVKENRDKNRIYIINKSLKYLLKFLI
jgi:nicotinamide-nucleotide amidase